MVVSKTILSSHYKQKQSMLLPLLEILLAPFIFPIQLFILKPIESIGGEKIDLDKRLLTNSNI